MLPANYVKTMVRVSLHEVKFRLVADRLGSGPAKRRRESEKVLCCLFMNGMTFTLQTGYGWWEVSCGVTNLALKDYTNVRDKMRYIIRRNDVDYDKDESQTFFDKKDVIQLKLKYGKNLFFYGNLNYLDCYLNVPSILKIASFFDLHKEKVTAPKTPTNRSIRDVPKLFTIMTYLYTVHPSLTVTNFHVYLPADASDLDTPLTILSIPRIELRGWILWLDSHLIDNSVKSELTEEMKDLMVLHNYASRTTLLTVHTPKAEESVESERVLLSCSIQDVSLTICDASDVYTRADYINTYKYKAIHDFTMTVRFGFGTEG